MPWGSHGGTPLTAPGAPRLCPTAQDLSAISAPHPKTAPALHGRPPALLHRPPAPGSSGPPEPPSDPRPDPPPRIPHTALPGSSRPAAAPRRPRPSLPHPSRAPRSRRSRRRPPSPGPPWWHLPSTSASGHAAAPPTEGGAAPPLFGPANPCARFRSAPRPRGKSDQSALASRASRHRRALFQPLFPVSHAPFGFRPITGLLSCHTPLSPAHYPHRLLPSELTNPLLRSSDAAQSAPAGGSAAANQKRRRSAGRCIPRWRRCRAGRGASTPRRWAWTRPGASRPTGNCAAEAAKSRRRRCSSS